MASESVIYNGVTFDCLTSSYTVTEDPVRVSTWSVDITFLITATGQVAFEAAIDVYKNALSTLDANFDYRLGVTSHFIWTFASLGGTCTPSFNIPADNTHGAIAVVASAHFDIIAGPGTASHSVTYNTQTLTVARMTWNCNQQVQQTTAATRTYSFEVTVEGATPAAFRAALDTFVTAVEVPNGAFSLSFGGSVYDSWDYATGGGALATTFSIPSYDQAHALGVVVNLQIAITTEAGSFQTATSYSAVGWRTIQYTRREHLTTANADVQARDYIDNTFVMPTGFSLTAISDTEEESTTETGGANVGSHEVWISYSWTLTEESYPHPTGAVEYDFSIQRSWADGNAVAMFFLTAISGTLAIARDDRTATRSQAEFEALFAQKATIENDVLADYVQSGDFVISMNFVWLTATRSVNFAFTYIRPIAFGTGDEISSFREFSLSQNVTFNPQVTKIPLATGGWQTQEMGPAFYLVRIVGSFLRLNRPIRFVKPPSDLVTTLVSFNESQEAPRPISPSVFAFKAGINVEFHVAKHGVSRTQQKGAFSGQMIGGIAFPIIQNLVAGVTLPGIGNVSALNSSKLYGASPDED